MNEFLKIEGRLVIMEREADDLKNRLKGLVKALRDNLDLMENVQDLDGDIIAAQAVEFARTRFEYLEILARIREAKRILGRS